MKDDYEKISQGDNLRIDGLVEAIKDKDEVKIVEENGKYEITGKLNLSARDREILLCGRAAEIYARTGKQESWQGKPNDEDGFINIDINDSG